MNNLNDIFAYQEDYAKKRKVPIMLDDSLPYLLDEVKRAKPDSILEIGTAIGYSGLKMLSVAPNATLTTIELDEERYDIAKNCFIKANVINRVTMHLGDCTEIIRYIDGKFDFIFVDGPKGHYAEMLPYLKNLLADNGKIFADNIIFKGKAVGDDYPEHKHRTIVNSLRKYRKDLLEDGNFSVKEYDAGDGIIIATKI